jgi:SsrA-binding protein
MVGMKKKTPSANVIDNRRARFDYDVKTVYMAGLILSGAEVKSLRMHHGHLRGAYVTLKDGEAWLINATITPLKTNAAHLTEQDQTRTRKLLLKASELDELAEAKTNGLTIVPLRLLTGKRFIKVEIATARGKRKYDKREVIKKRDQERDAGRMLS